MHDKGNRLAGKHLVFRSAGTPTLSQFIALTSSMVKPSFPLYPIRSTVWTFSASRFTSYPRHDLHFIADL